MKLPFADGEYPKKPRPYLVIGSSIENLYLLNVSSVQSKVWKLSMPSNKNIDRYNPPFKKPSFAKMDYVYQIPYQDYVYKYLLNNGKKLHNETLDDLLECLTSFKGKKIHKINKEQISQLNTVQ